jgi:hypothetical protein
MTLYILCTTKELKFVYTRHNNSMEKWLQMTPRTCVSELYNYPYVR